MIPYEIIFFIDEKNIIKHIELRAYNGEEYVSQVMWSKYLGRDINSLLHIDIDKICGFINWNGEPFRYTRIKNKLGTGYIIDMIKTVNKSKIYEKAMDHIAEGIQVYDRMGHLIFCNKSSEKMEKTNRENIIGKHLLDIYDLNEDYSTILNTLKSKKPVLNRCDIFKNKSGDSIITMNSGYPLLEENELIGAVAIVQDMNVLEDFWSKINALESFISRENNNKDIENTYYSRKYYTFKDLIGEEKNFRESVKLAQRVALKDCPVLIYGETGTGKELFAQSIHSSSKRKDKEFIAINCAAIPENLIEGILFGTEKGAFTGSTQRMGLFEQARGGTIFLDELNSMGLNMQSKLLRVLQEKRFRRVGGLKDIECDVRIISSTNEEPFKAIKNNKLRKDLYFRLSTVTITIPPLRERKGDIKLLTDYFLKRFSKYYFKIVNRISEDVLKIFYEYEWPGNVRELMHVIEYAFNVMDDDIIMVEHLPKYLQKQYGAEKKNKSENNRVHIECQPILQQETLEQLMSRYEKEVIFNTLKRYGNNVTKAANALGIKRQSLQYRIKKYRLKV